MKITEKGKILDGTALKLIAVVSMVLDHMGDNFFPDQLWMRALGRLAMPIFAFCIAEGLRHTHDKGKYLRRMLLFGLLSEIPFDLVTSGRVLEFGHQNIMLSFAWAILAMLCLERIRGEKWTKGKVFFAAAAMLGFLAGSVLLRLDYNMLATGLVGVFYLLRERSVPVRTAGAAALHALLRNVGIHWFGLLGFVPILLYNGKRGRGLKWLFYVFYPGHLLLIWLIRSMM